MNQAGLVHIVFVRFALWHQQQSIYVFHQEFSPLLWGFRRESSRLLGPIADFMAFMLSVVLVSRELRRQKADGYSNLDEKLDIFDLWVDKYRLL